MFSLLGIRLLGYLAKKEPKTFPNFHMGGMVGEIDPLDPLAAAGFRSPSGLTESRLYTESWIPGEVAIMRSLLLRPAAVILLAFTFPGAGFAQESSGFGNAACEGDYQHHLQGVCTDESEAIFWSFTTELVKTDRSGKVQKRIPVANHHGDLCFHKGKIYVAVNLGRFNDPKGNADSWVYVYDAETLEELSKQEVQEVFHGAGGMDVKGGHFFIVGGLPDGVEQNYVYEYDEAFRFVKKHIIESKWTRLGIQTAAWHDGAWWFGCYGAPQILLKTDGDFEMLGRYEFDCSLGIVGIDKDLLLVARGPRTEAGRCRGTLNLAQPDGKAGLVLLPADKP